MKEYNLRLEDFYHVGAGTEVIVDTYNAKGVRAIKLAPAQVYPHHPGIKHLDVFLPDSAEIYPLSAMVDDNQWFKAVKLVECNEWHEWYRNPEGYFRDHYK